MISAANSIVETDFATVVGAIYDAALTPIEWPRVMELCRDFVGGASAAVFAKNVTGNRCRLYFDDARIDPETTQRYFGQLSGIDPTNPVQCLADVDRAVIVSQSLSPEDFAETRFAKEWATPMGLVDAVSAPIERRGSWAALFAVFRHEKHGLADEATRDRVAMLVPHIRRAVDIADLVGDAGREAATWRGVVDGLSSAVLVVDSDGRLVHCNLAGQLLVGPGRLLGTNGDGTLRLDRTGLRAVLAGGAGSHTFLDAAGTRYVAHVMPLTGANLERAEGEAAAAVFIQPASFNPTSVPEALLQAFELTPAELRVALAAVQHNGVPDMAEKLGISEATVKTHLSRVFSKTDTRRQSDIVKLMAAFASPLALH